MSDRTRLEQLRENAAGCETHEDMAGAYESLSDALESRVTSLEIKLGEALRLIELVSHEFTSDPMSVQCFDIRAIVEPVNRLAEQIRAERAEA